MPPIARLGILLMLGIAGTPSALCAQPVVDESGGLRQLRPLTREECNQREAQRLFGFGLLHERKHEITEAVESIQEAIKLDPEAAALHKELLGLYLGLGRRDEAMVAARRALELNPGDYDTWIIFARELKEEGHPRDAAEALARAVACPSLHDNAELSIQVSFTLATLYEETQQYERALVPIRQLLQVFQTDQGDPRAAEAYEMLGRVHLKARQCAEAVAALEAARRLLQTREPARARRLDFQLAEVLIDIERLDEALAHLDAYLQTQPPGVKAYELKIAVLTKLHQGDAVVPFLRAAARRDNHNIDLQMLLAQRCTAAHLDKEAEQIYLSLTQDAPTPALYQRLFGLYRAQGHLCEALQMLNQMLATVMGHDSNPAEAGAAARGRAMLAVLEHDDDLARALVPAAKAWLEAGHTLQPEAERLLAALAGRTHQLELAEEFFRRCLAEPLNPETEAGLVEGLLLVLWEAGKYDAVVGLCRQGLRESHAPRRDLLLHSSLARALVMLGQTEEAVWEAGRLVQLADDETRLHWSLFQVEILIRAERFAQAESRGLALLTKTTRTADIRRIRYTLSNVYSASRRLDQAEEQLRLVLQDDPDDAGASNDLGYFLADEGRDLEEAERLIRHALARDRERKQQAARINADDVRENAAYIDSLGWVLFRRGRLSESLVELRKAAALPEGARDPVVWGHLGDVHFRLQEMKPARCCWEKAVSFYETDRARRRDENYKDLKHKLELLESEAHH
jgi:tetratricopeptide (TPR) repeat protein